MVRMSMNVWAEEGPVSFFESVYHMPAAYFLYALNK